MPFFSSAESKKTLTMGLYGAHEKLVSQQGLLLGKEVVNNLREGKKTLKVENDIDYEFSSYIK